MLIAEPTNRYDKEKLLRELRHNLRALIDCQDEMYDDGYFRDTTADLIYLAAKEYVEHCERLKGDKNVSG